MYSHILQSKNNLKSRSGHLTDVRAEPGGPGCSGSRVAGRGSLILPGVAGRGRLARAGGAGVVPLLIRGRAQGPRYGASSPLVRCELREAIRVAAAARRKLARPPPLHNQLSLLSRGRYFALSSFRSLPRALCWNWRRPHVAAPPTQPRRSPSSSGLTLERRYPAAAQPTSAARTPRNGIATAANRTAAPAGAPVSPLRAQTGRQTDSQISITISNKFRTRLVSLTICE